MIKKWELEKFFSIQNAAQQMKTIERNKEIWHEESDQKHMFENMQQAAEKKISSTATIINAD